MSAPLDGLTVLDASQLLPGPYAAQMLGDLGAEVIKIEPPRGDAAREFRGDIFTVANRNKTSRLLDLKSTEGRAELLRLAATCDVFFEGYRPGVAERLGIGYDDLAAINPGIVYCSITGYGRGDERSGLPGHDINYIAAAGALSFSGHWGQRPQRPGVPLADMGAASYAVIAILAALRERDRTGRGGHVDVSMTDVMLAWASVRGGAHLDTGVEVTRHLYPTNDVFVTRDGRRIAIGALEERFWQQARPVLAQVEPRLAEPRWDDEQARTTYAQEAYDLVAGAVAQRDLAGWLEAFAGVDTPVSPVASLAEAVEARAGQGDGLVRELDGQRHVVFPVKLNGEVLGTLRAPAPALPDLA